MENLKVGDFVKVVAEKDGQGSGIIGSDFILAVGYVFYFDKDKNGFTIYVKSITNDNGDDDRPLPFPQDADKDESLKVHTFMFDSESEYNVVTFEKITLNQSPQFYINQLMR
tara:strand:- start:476 stop:811 length:336 start_codon:yes stop_codon:yes gene_type:complete